MQHDALADDEHNRWRDDGRSSKGKDLGQALILARELHDLYRRERAQSAQLRAWARQLALLAQVSRQLASARNLGETIEIVFDLSQNVLQAPAALLALPNRTDQSLEVVLTRGLGNAVALGFQVGWNEPTIGWSAAHGSPLVIEDLTSLASSRLVKRLLKARLGSAVSVPLIANGRCVGVLESYYPPSGIPYLDNHLLESLSSHAGVAIASTQHQVAELLEFSHLSRAISAQESLEQLRQTIVERVRATFDAQCVALYSFESARADPREVAANHDHHLADCGLSADLMSSLSEDTPLIVAERPSGRVAAALLRTGSYVIGALALSLPPTSVLSPARQLMLSALAGAAAAALRNAELYRWSEELAITQERNRIAREIHDGLLQSLVQKRLRLSVCLKLLEREPERVRRELESVLESLRHDIQDVRHSILALRPVHIEERGLEDALRSFAKEFAEETGLDLDLKLNVSAKRPIPPKLQTALFRITQEALNNVRKHARARRVWIELWTEGESVTLRVQDDGQGFQLKPVVRRPGLRGVGLSSMRERAEAAGGTLLVESEPGRGTTVTAILPCPVATTSK